MEPSDHRTPASDAKPPAPPPIESSPGQIPTISSLNHILSAKDIEEILDIELGTQTDAVIKMMSSIMTRHNKPLTNFDYTTSTSIQLVQSVAAHATIMILFINQ